MYLKVHRNTRKKMTTEILLEQFLGLVVNLVAETYFSFGINVILSHLLQQTEDNSFPTNSTKN